MKKISLTLLCSLFVTFIQAQFNYQWAKRTNTQSNSHDVVPTATATDNQGNIYTVGYFNGKVNFDPSFVFNPAAVLTAKIEPNAQGSITLCTDVFVTKFDPNGKLKWVKQWGSTSGDVGLSIAVDANGNVYTTGNCSGEVDFDPSPNKTYIIKGNLYTAFISKLDTDGNFKWAKRVDGDSRGYSLALDGSANVYVAGWAWGNNLVDFDPGPAKATAKDGNIFVLKLNSSGSFQWVKGIGGFQNIPQTTRKEYHIATDASGNVYTTGCFTKTGDFNPGNAINTLTSKGLNDVFISKLNSSGNYIWAKQLGGIKDDYSTGIAIDAEKNVYTIGTFSGSADFNPSAANFPLSSFGLNDIFISKLNTNGDFVWAKQLGGALNDKANGIAIDKENNIYTTGCFSQIADFNPKEGFNIFPLTSNGSFDIFISKLTNNGDFIWAKQIGGTGNDQAATICTQEKNIVIAGNFANTVDFDPNEGVKNLVSLHGNGSTGLSMFLAKYNQNPIFIPIPLPLFFPEINVKQVNKDIPSGGNFDFGSVAINTNKDIVFTIQNTGAANLNLNSINVSGDFIKTGIAPNNTVKPATEVQFTVRMVASAIAGNKNGKITIANNDADESSYVINLTGFVDDLIEKVLPDNPRQKNEANSSRSLQSITTAYPNPTHAGWNISFAEDMRNSNYTLVSRQGSVITKGVIYRNNLYLPAERLSAGMYFLHVSNSTTTGVIQLIKE